MSESTENKALIDAWCCEAKRVLDFLLAWCIELASGWVLSPWRAQQQEAERPHLQQGMMPAPLQKSRWKCYWAAALVFNSCLSTGGTAAPALSSDSSWVL